MNMLLRDCEYQCFLVMIHVKLFKPLRQNILVILETDIWIFDNPTMTIIRIED